MLVVLAIFPGAFRGAAGEDAAAFRRFVPAHGSARSCRRSRQRHPRPGRGRWRFRSSPRVPANSSAKFTSITRSPIAARLRPSRRVACFGSSDSPLPLPCARRSSHFGRARRSLGRPRCVPALKSPARRASGTRRGVTSSCNQLNRSVAIKSRRLVHAPSAADADREAGRPNESRSPCRGSQRNAGRAATDVRLLQRFITGGRFGQPHRCR